MERGNSKNHSDFYEKLERFKITLETRNFEIELFWKRCNYFLALNTAVMVGFFVFQSRIEGAIYDLEVPTLMFSFLLTSIGFAVSWAWTEVTAGGKYWQSHWEQVVIEMQESIGFHKADGLDYFSVEGTKERVMKNLGVKNEKMSFLTSCCPISKEGYDKWVLTKPSVSHWMHITAMSFSLVWIYLVAFHIILASAYFYKKYAWLLN